MPPDPKNSRGPAAKPDPDQQGLATDQSERIALRVPLPLCRSVGCVIACSPSSCLGCADRVEVAA